LDIAILVNNVGNLDCGLFHELEYQQIIDTISINCTAMAALNAALLNKIKDRP
jgi:short-subunit dehydrogenase